MFPTDPPVTGSGFEALFKNRTFLVLWAGQILSQIADKVFFVLLIVLAEEYKPPGFGTSMRSVVMVANTLPAIFLGSAAGIFVDRLAKKTILGGSNLIRGLMMLTLPVLPKGVGILVMIAVFESILTQFFAPAELAAIPLAVEKQCLMSANALFSTTMLGALIVGFAIGGPLLNLARSVGGNLGPAFLVGGLYLLAACVLYLLPVKERIATVQVNEAEALSGFQAIWYYLTSEFKSGLDYLKSNRLVSSAMIQITILYSVFAALMVLAVNLTKQIGLLKTEFGFLLAAAGIGLVFGAGLLGQWGSRSHGKPLPLIGFLSIAAVLGSFTLVSDRWLGLGLSMLLGVGASLIAVPMQTLIQQQTPESMRGKVFGFQNNLVNIALAAPLAVVGPLTDATGKVVGQVLNWFVTQRILNATAIQSIDADAIGLRIVLLVLSALVAWGGMWAWRRSRQVLQEAI